ncbi:hypothetical protein [Swingsia samuiensis]|uniref:Uncharacterized protein n=1 Tax=Swingsia samuiensis TaxID=1293412 RepID=A0A4Y6ULW6_9PROT|nr:hypothetical protein [Swingsia samuiensis]QDH17386.1 hypothetical protein E3D00_07285 [Swingsia samuiensis]
MHTIAPFLPARYSADLLAIVTFLISTCALIARFWARPKDGSKWLFLYVLINQIAMNSNHATNADDVDPHAGKT